MTKQINKGDLRESLMIWLPTGDQGIDNQQLEDFLIARQALEDFIALKISPQTFAEILYDCGVDIDSYLEDVSNNMINL